MEDLDAFNVKDNLFLSDNHNDNENLELKGDRQVPAHPGQPVSSNNNESQLNQQLDPVQPDCTTDQYLPASQNSDLAASNEIAATNDLTNGETQPADDTVQPKPSKSRGRPKNSKTKNKADKDGVQSGHGKNL